MAAKAVVKVAAMVAAAAVVVAAAVAETNCLSPKLAAAILGEWVSQRETRGGLREWWQDYGCCLACQPR